MPQPEFFVSEPGEVSLMTVRDVGNGTHGEANYGNLTLSDGAIGASLAEGYSRGGGIGARAGVKFGMDRKGLHVGVLSFKWW